MIKYLVRILFFPILIVELVDCSSDPEWNVPARPAQAPSEYYLKEYYEENILRQSFEYDGDRLRMLWRYSNRGQSSMQFIYRPDGRLDSVYVRQRYFPRDLIIHYDDSLMSEFEVWNGNKLRQMVYFDRDDKGRIIHMYQVSLVFGLLSDVYFEWEGPDISRYESTVYDYPYVATYVYEFTCDQFRNPYSSVFKYAGFNFLDNLPLTENNWLELLVYTKGAYEQTKTTYLNKFGYGGKYPFVNESTQIKNKERTAIYAEYKY